MKAIRQRQRGISLLEALVAVVVLSMGLLSLASLQASSVKNNQGALLRSAAVAASYSLVDRMQAARVLEPAANRKTPADYAAAMTFPTVSGSCAVPTGSSIEQQDLAEWITGAGGLQQTLGPGACGGVRCNANDECIVRVVWSDTRSTQIEANNDEMLVDVQVRIR